MHPLPDHSISLRERFTRIHNRRKDPNRAFNAILVLGLALMMLNLWPVIGSIIALGAFVRLVWVLVRITRFDNSVGYD